MSKLNPAAQTLIWCPDIRDTSKSWYAHGTVRAEAEMIYMKAVSDDIGHTPAYRIVAQRKVDQYDHMMQSVAFH